MLFATFIDELLKAPEFNIFLRLIVAIVLGIVVGLGKEFFVKPAGFRVSVLTTIASCLITLVGVYSFPEAISSIILGVLIFSGLITLGIINNNRGEYQGLVSASMIVLCAVIGVVSATGMYFAAVCTTLLTIIAMIIMKAVEKKVLVKGYVLNLIVDIHNPVLKNLLDIFNNYHLSPTLMDSKVVLYERKECIKIRVEFVRATPKTDIERVIPVINEKINPLSVSLRNDTYGVIR